MTMEDIESAPSQARALSNTALKSIRDTNENPPGYPVVGRVDLFETPDGFLIKTLQRDKGMDYILADPLQPWSWRSMLKGMQRPTMERIVGAGIIDICCMPIEGSYDQKRWHAAKHLDTPFAADAPVQIWDFVVTRADSTSLRFHTSQTTNKVEIVDVLFPFERTGPVAGRGLSDGPGTYRQMVNNSYPEVGAFVQPKGKGRGKGKPSAAVAAASAKGEAKGEADPDPAAVAAASASPSPSRRLPVGVAVQIKSRSPSPSRPPPGLCRLQLCQMDILD